MKFKLKQSVVDEYKASKEKDDVIDLVESQDVGRQDVEPDVKIEDTESTDRLLAKMTDEVPAEQEDIEVPKETIREQFTEPTPSDVFAVKPVKPMTFTEKKQEAVRIKELQKNYRNTFESQGESVLFEVQELPDKFATDTYDAVRNEVIDTGAKQFSIESKVANLKNVSPEADEIALKGLALKDNYDYIYENVFSARQKTIADLQKRQLALSKQLKQTPNDVNVIKMAASNHALLDRERGKEWEPLMNEKGEFIDKKWDRPQEKTQAIRKKTEEYKTWDKNALIDLFNNLVAKHKYIKDVEDRNISSEVKKEYSKSMAEHAGAAGFGSQYMNTRALKVIDNKRKRLLEKGGVIEDELEAISHALILNQDPASMKEAWYGYAARGLKSYVEESLGINTISTKSEMQEAYANAVREGGGKLSENQVESLNRSVLDKSLMALGYSIPLGLEITATTLATEGVGTAINAGKYFNFLKTATKAKYGETGAAFLDMMAGTAKQGLIFGLSPNESISAEMGAAEGLTQKLLDFKFKGKNVGKIGEFLTRSFSGMAAETTAEFAGDFAKSMKDNGYDVDKALENTFGKTGDEIWDNILTTAILTGTFSTSSNLANLTKLRENASQLPDSENKIKIISDIYTIIEDVKKSNTTEEAVVTPEKVTTEGEVEQEVVKEEIGTEPKAEEEVVKEPEVLEEKKEEEIEEEEVIEEDKFDSLTSALNIDEDVSDIVGEKSKAGDIEGAKIILDTGKEGDIKLESITVPQEKRQQGNAEKAMDKLTEKADELDATIELDAIPEEGSNITQEDLISFYENHGFEFEGTKGVRKPTMALAAETELTLMGPSEFERGKIKGKEIERAQAAKKAEKVKTSYESQLGKIKEKINSGNVKTTETVKFIKDTVKKIKDFPYKGKDMVSLTGKVAGTITKAREAVRYLNAKEKSVSNIKSAVEGIKKTKAAEFDLKKTKAAIRKVNSAVNRSKLESESLTDIKTDLNALVTDLDTAAEGDVIVYNNKEYSLDNIVDAIDGDTRISDAINEIESDQTIRMAGKSMLFEEVLDEFSNSVDALFSKGVETTRKSTQKTITDIVKKKRFKSIKGKKTGTSTDAETQDYFSYSKDVIKSDPAEKMTMQLEAEELLYNNYEGSPEYEQGVLMMKALEDFGNFNELTLNESEALLAKIKDIDKNGREAIKKQKGRRAYEVEQINEDIENNVDKSYVDIDPVSRAKKEITKSGLIDADLSFMERMNAKMKAAKINTAEGMRKFFGKSIMQWSLMAETILSFVDTKEKTFGTGKLKKRTVSLVEKARRNYLKGRYEKEFNVMSTYDAIFNDKTVSYNKKEIVESRKRFRKQANEWQLEKMNIPVSIDGEADIIPMTKDQAMRIYAWSKNKELQKELGDQFGLTADAIEQLKIKLGEKEVAFVDYVVDDFMDSYYNDINSAYKEMYFTNLPKVDSYFPVRRVGMKKEVEVANNTPVSSVITATMASALKQRQKSTARLEINDEIDSGFLSGLFNHINEMEHVIHFGEAARDVSVALSNPYLRAALDRYGVRDIINKQFREAITQDMGYIGSIPILNKVIDAYTLAALGAKLNMTIKQPTSFINAMSDYEYDGEFKAVPGINSAMFMKDVAKIIGNPSKARTLFNELYISSPVFRERIDSYRTANADLITNASARKPYKKMSAKEAIHSATMAPIRWGDQLGILYGYGAIYQNEINKGKTKQEAIEAFEQYEKTQQTRSAIHLTGAQINKSAFSRFFTAFKSSSFQYFNQSFGSANSIYRSLKRDKKIYKKDVKRLVVNHALTYMLFQMATSLPKAFRDDNEEFWDDVFSEGFIGSADGMFLMSGFTEWMYEVGSEMYDRYTKKPSERGKFKVRDLSFTLDIERPFNKVIRDLNKEDTDKLQTAAIFASHMAGLPAQTALQIANGVIDIGEGDYLNGLFRVFGYTDWVIGEEEETGRKRIKRKSTKLK